MKNQFTTTLSALALVLPILAHGYEVDTHQQFSVTAYQKSDIYQNNKQILKDYGFDTQIKYPDSNGKLRFFNDLIGFGSVNEDNLTQGYRVFNHFYNPIAPLGDQGLKIDVINTYFNTSTPMLSELITPLPTWQNDYSSPDWAIEDNRQIVDSNYGALPTGMGMGMNFSWADAREYLYKALTLPSKIERDKNIGIAFESLGHIIHHIQDMAQPQHVRNDPHDPKTDSLRPSYVHASLYEAYTNQKAINNELTAPAYTSMAPIYPAQDPKLFEIPRDFWAKPTLFPTQKTGLAPFTNENFFSAGTNAGPDNSPSAGILWANYKQYPLTTPSIMSFGTYNIYTTTVAGVCQIFTCAPALLQNHGSEQMSFYWNNVYDNTTNGPAQVNNYATTKSIFSDDLVGINQAPLFTMNRFNFESGYSFLLPRAVSYSAGLINFFFRGKVDMVPDPTNLGSYLINNLGAEDLNGSFELYYDLADGTRKPVADAQNQPMQWNLAIAANKSSTPVIFTAPTDAATPGQYLFTGQYLLVFHGDLGKENSLGGNVFGAVTAKLIVPPGKLNDTGITTCSDGFSHSLPCPVAGFPGQDGEYGRDVKNNDDSDGHAGFSFTKIGADGSGLPLNAPSWSCVKDNVTGLIWQRDVSAGLFTNLSPEFPSPGFPIGSYGSVTDATGYVTTVNRQGLCGANNWRLPSADELQSIVDYSIAYPAPAIDSVFFPGTPATSFWSSSPNAGDPSRAWFVTSYYGNVNMFTRLSHMSVRLVRAGQ